MRRYGKPVYSRRRVLSRTDWGKQCPRCSWQRALLDLIGWKSRHHLLSLPQSVIVLLWACCAACICSALHVHSSIDPCTDLPESTDMMFVAPSVCCLLVLASVLPAGKTKTYLAARLRLWPSNPWRHGKMNYRNLAVYCQCCWLPCTWFQWG